MRAMRVLYKVSFTALIVLAMIFIFQGRNLDAGGFLLEAAILRVLLSVRWFWE